MYGEKHDNDFIANLLSPKVKEFWKSANNCQSSLRIISLVFFITHSVHLVIFITVYLFAVHILRSNSMMT